MYTIIIVIILILVVGAIAYFYYRKKKQEHAEKLYDDVMNHYTAPYKRVADDIKVVTAGIKLTSPAILTKSVVNHGKIISQITIYQDGKIIFTRHETKILKKEVQLTPDELDEIIKLRDEIHKKPPWVSADGPVDEPVSYLTLHDNDKIYCTHGSCEIHTMVAYDKLDKFLEAQSGFSG